MSNKRDRRRKGVIYPGQSGTGRIQNTFFTETGKEPVYISRAYYKTKGYKKASYRNGTRFDLKLCFSGCQALNDFVIFKLIVSVIEQFRELFPLFFTFSFPAFRLI